MSIAAPEPKARDICRWIPISHPLAA